MQPETEHRTDRRVEVHKSRVGGIYTVTVEGTNHRFEGTILNIGGRAAAFGGNTTLELGGGESDVIIREYDDSRADDGTLIAIGFEADAAL